MGKTLKRHEVLARLQKTIESDAPILGAGCSAGIVAKCAELAGADLILVYSSGKSRLMGLPTTVLGDSNSQTLAMVDEILNVTKDVPIIGGVEAIDPTHLDLSRLVHRFVDAGFSGVINYPTLGFYPTKRRFRDQVGLGFAREAELMSIARSEELFSMAYVFNPADAQTMAEAGADCVCAHVGATVGGLAGYESDYTIMDACREVEEIVAAARRINPSVVCLAHGGPFSVPEDTQRLYVETSVVGYVGASSIERIPIERAITNTVRGFKSVGRSK